MQQVFSEIYAKRVWGNGSGGGSSVEFNKDTFIPFMKQFMVENKIEKIVDLGCGDWQSSHLLYTDPKKYVGYDCVESVIDENKQKFPLYTFNVLDFSNVANVAQIQDAGANGIYVLKDVLQHWSTQKVIDFLDKIVTTKKFKMIVVCNCVVGYQAPDIRDGDFRILPPLEYPMALFNPIVVYSFHTKQVSIIVKR
jgi:SAM-dependent methyltransferase